MTIFIMMVHTYQHTLLQNMMNQIDVDDRKQLELISTMDLDQRASTAGLIKKTVRITFWREIGFCET